MAIDQVSLEVTSALEARGIVCLPIKGPVLADWLYRGTVRRYGDTDLLVSPDDLLTAQKVLRGLGFTPKQEPAQITAGMPTFHAWSRHGMWSTWIAA